MKSAFLSKVSSVLCAFILLTTLAASSPLIIHEERHTLSGRRPGQPVDRSSVITFQVALKQNNLEHGYDYLLNISHPTSPHYGKIWSASDVRKTFAPSLETIRTVHDWLTNAGIDDLTESRGGGWLSFQSTAGYMEDVLKTEFFEYNNHENGAARIGCERYYLPEDVSKHVDFITPGVALSAPYTKRVHSRQRGDPQLEWRTPEPNENGEFYSLSSRDEALPPDLQKFANANSSGPIHSVGLFEYKNTYNQTDLNLFYKLFAPEILNGTRPKTDWINTPPGVSQHDREISYETPLDLSVMYPIVYPQTITIYQTEPDLNGVPVDPNKDIDIILQEALDAIDASFCPEDPIPNSQGSDCGDFSRTQVISFSYGNSEITQPELYTERQCNEFMKLALQGMTFTVASGDYGVARFPADNRADGKYGTTNGCIVVGNFNATESAYHALNGTVFNPSYPATCPYVLSVGGTQLQNNHTVGDAESVMILPHYTGNLSKIDLDFSSGGGFSNYFNRPGYQNAAVNSYFSQHDPGYPYYHFNGVALNTSGNNIGANGGLYNRGGRGVPDVSALGRNVQYIRLGMKLSGSGTSCATPIWGGIFAVINEKRAQVGKGPVGFVNPVLYEHPEVFNDITIGTNPGCYTKGFPAVKGWDPSTGLGTPNYPKLLELFLSLP